MIFPHLPFIQLSISKDITIFETIQTATVLKNCSSSDRVDYLGGATFLTNESSRYDGQGITIGNFINIDIHNTIESDCFDDYVTTNPLYMHEYGHTIDGRKHGPSYLFAVGIPSLISAKKAKTVEFINYTDTHDYKEYEVRANRKAEIYFWNHYGVLWDSFRAKYPTEYNLFKK